MPEISSNWKTLICLAVLRRADFLCEGCKKEDHSIVWATGYNNVAKWWETLEEAEFEVKNKNLKSAPKPVKVKLAVTHMDQYPINPNVQLDRLRAWCQLCRLHSVADGMYKNDEQKSLAEKHERRFKKVHKRTVQTLA